jgi:peptide deformylase
MRETMYDENGVGIAAPQVGVSKRVVVIDVGEGPIDLINPVFLEKSEEIVQDAEGCLSIPGHTGDVRRHARVKVRALNRLGEEFIIEGKGLLSVALQHEIDHLDGILFVDREIKA